MVDEARDAAFLLMGAGTWVGKVAYLTADSVTIHEGRRTIAQAILENRVKARGPRHPHMNLLAQQPFQFNSLRNSTPKDMPRDDSSDYLRSPCQPSRGCEHNRRWREQGPQLPRFPLPSPDHGFKSDRSSLMMTSSMLSRSGHSDELRCSRWGRWHWEETCMKINLPIFKDDQLPFQTTFPQIE